MEFIHFLISSLFSPYKLTRSEGDINAYLQDIVPMTAWNDENFALQFILGGIFAEFLQEDNQSLKNGIRAFVKKSTFPHILLVDDDGTIVDLRMKTEGLSFLDQNAIDNLMCTFYPNVHTGKSIVMKIVIMNPATLNTAIQIYNHGKISSEPATDGFCEAHDFLEISSQLMTFYDDFMPDILPTNMRPIIKAVNRAIALYRFFNNQGDSLLSSRELGAKLDFSGIISGALLLSLHRTCNITIKQISDRLFIGVSLKDNSTSTAPVVLCGLTLSLFPFEVTVCFEIMMGLKIFDDSCTVVSLHGQVAINERHVNVLKFAKGFLRSTIDYVSRMHFEENGVKQAILDQLLHNLLKQPYMLDGCDGLYRLVGELLSLQKDLYPIMKPQKSSKLAVMCPDCLILVTKRRNVRFIFNIVPCKNDGRENIARGTKMNLKTCNIRHPHRRYQCSHLVNLHFAKTQSSITTTSIINKEFDALILSTSHSIPRVDLAQWLDNTNNCTQNTFSNLISSRIENNRLVDIESNRQMRHVISGIMKATNGAKTSTIKAEVLLLDYPAANTSLVIKTSNDDYVEIISEFVRELDLIIQLRKTRMLPNEIFIEMHVEPDTKNISVRITKGIERGGHIHSAQPKFRDYTQTVHRTCDNTPENWSRLSMVEKEVCTLITSLPKPSDFNRLKKLLKVVSRNAAVLTVLQRVRTRFENYQMVKFKNDLIYGKTAAIDPFLDRVLDSLTLHHENYSYSLVKSPATISVVKPSCNFIRTDDLLGHLSQQRLFHDKHNEQQTTFIYVSDILTDYCNICWPSNTDCKAHHDTRMLILSQGTSNFFNGTIHRFKQVIPYYAYRLTHTSITEMTKSSPNVLFCDAFVQLLDTSEGSFNITGCGEDNVLNLRLHDRVKSDVYVNRAPNRHNEDMFEWPPAVLTITGIHHVQLRLVGETFMDVDCTFRTVLIKKEDDSCDSIYIRHTSDYCAHDLRIYLMGNSRIFVHNSRSIRFIIYGHHTIEIFFYRSASDFYIFQINLNIIDLLVIQSLVSEFTLTFKEGGKLLIRPNHPKDELRLHFQDAVLVLSIFHFPIVLIEVDISTKEVHSWLENLKFRNVYIDVYCRKSHELYSVRSGSLHTTNIPQCISVQTHTKVVQHFLTDLACFEININAQYDKNVPAPTVYLTSVDDSTVFHVHTKPLCGIRYSAELCQIAYVCTLKTDSVTITISVKIDPDTADRKIVDLSFSKLNVGKNHRFPTINFYGHGKLTFLYDPMMNRARVVPQTLRFDQGTQLAILDSCYVEPRTLIVVDQHRRFFDTYRVHNHLVFTTVTKAIIKQRYKIRLFTLTLLDFFVLGLEKMVLIQFTRGTVDVAKAARAARSLGNKITKFQAIDRGNAELITLFTPGDVSGESDESAEDHF